MTTGAASTTTCPKCATEQPAGDACRRCGLVYANWRGDEADPYTGIAGELWSRCVEAWDDASRHDAFLLFCRREGSLPYAAGRYRAVLQARPDDPVAGKRMSELIKLAEFAAQAEVHQTSARRKQGRTPYRSVAVLAVGAVALMAAALAFFLLMKMVR